MSEAHSRPPARPAAAVVYEREVMIDLGCGRWLARRLLHELGIRIGGKRRAIPRDVWDAFLLRNQR